MHGRISALVVGLGLAVGGGIAGAALVSQEPAQAPAAPSAEAELAAAEAEKLAQASATHALKVAQKARRIARRARSKSNESLATATALLDDVDKALAESAESLAVARQAEQDAANALQAANATSNRLDSTQIVSDSESGLVQTDEENDYVALGGPQVTVSVPSSGLIEVWATVTFGEDGNNAVAADGAVALYQDGQRVTQIDEENLCQSLTGSLSLENMLLSTSGPPGVEIPLSTPGAAEIFAGGCGSIGSTPSPILLQATPGNHTYELRYGDCGCEPEPSGFRERTLRVAPHL